MVRKHIPNPKGNIKPGQVLNPKGRPKGSRNRINEHFLHKVEEHFIKFSESALNRMCFDNPTAYMNMVAALLPKKLEIDGSSETPETPVSVINIWISELIARGTAQQIENTGENRPLLPAPLCIEQAPSGSPVDICKDQGSGELPEWLSRPVGKGTLEK